MAIASWSGPIRKYKETPVSMKAKEALVTIDAYVDKFLDGKADQTTTMTAIQLTLELCLGRQNYRKIIIPILKNLTQNPEDKENLLSSLLKQCKDHSKS